MIKFYFKSILLFAVIFGFTVVFQSCSTVYYVGETTEVTTIYASEDVSAPILYTAPAGTKFLIKKKKKKYYHIVYDNYQGYLYAPVFSNYHRFNSVTDGTLYGYSTVKTQRTRSSSYHSTSNSSSGTVNVKGYYRKNGTYVRSHTRSSPKRRG